MPSLEKLVGQVIIALVPIFHNTIFQKLKLHSVEPAGIWVESQSITNQILGMARVRASPKTMIFFLPFSQISFVMSSLDVPGLSDEEFPERL